MNNLLVNLMNVLQFAQVNALRGPHKFHLSSVSGYIVERDNHTAGNVEKLVINFKYTCAHLHVLFKSMRARSIAHECSTELQQILLSAEGLCNMYGNPDLIL